MKRGKFSDGIRILNPEMFSYIDLLIIDRQM